MIETKDDINRRKFDVEVGENHSSSVCHCCGHESNIGHGFVYKNGDAYAVYYAGWSKDHSDKKVSFAIAVGEWEDNSTINDRTCLGIEVYVDERGILYSAIDPDQSPWANTELLGKMISRKDALHFPFLQEIFGIAECVVRNHDAIREYLEVVAV